MNKKENDMDLKKNGNQYVAVDERRRLRRVGRNTENGRHDEPSTSPNHVSHLLGT